MPAVSETIFDLIPSPDPIPSRPDRYICRMPWNTPPTSSTIGIASSTQIPITNLSGSLSPPPSAHQYRHERALFGRSSSCRPEPADYLRKSSNAIEVILSEPIKREQRLRSDIAGRHPNYGKVPEYLNGIKDEIAVEYDYIERIRSTGQAATAAAPKQVQIVPLDDDERVRLLDALKIKWVDIQRQYQSITHHIVLDTISQVHRKEKYEHDLSRIEADIALLSKPNILIRK